MYTGLYEYWQIRLNQGQYVLTEIKKQLQKAYYVDSAITETEYNNLLTLAEQKADPNYKPNATLASLQQENTELKKELNQLSDLLITVSMQSENQGGN